jgi:hypothetical protein
MTAVISYARKGLLPKQQEAQKSADAQVKAQRPVLHLPVKRPENQGLLVRSDKNAS